MNIKEELILLQGKLRAEKQALANLATKYDAICILACTEAVSSEEVSALRSQRELLEARIRGLEILVGEKEAASKAFDKAIFDEFQRKHEETEKAEKLKRWRALNSQCAAARKEMESTVTPLKEAQDAVDKQAGVIQLAQNEWSHHVEGKPRFATDDELAAWNARLQALEAAVAESFAEMRRRDDIRTCVVQRQVQARNEFERLAFQVRMSQPPEEPLPKSQLTAR